MASIPDHASANPSYHEGPLKAQLRVIHALTLRELHFRYGRENLGFLWIIGEPMLLATVITLIHVGEPTHFANDIQPAPFAIIGYTIFIVFRNTFNRAEGAIESNQSLLYHKKLTILDIMISRIGMEVLGCYATMALLLGIAVLTGYSQLPVRPLYLITAALLMAWLTFGLTLIAACASYRNEIVARQLHVLSYFSIPISGAFFQMNMLPTSFSSKLAWFPMTLIFEQARYGQFQAASAKFVDPGYVIACCAGLTYIGLIMVRRIRARIHA